MATISVILNSYNQKEFFEQSITSVLNQSYNDFELIISENGSTDGSKKIIEKYKNIRNIKILDYPKNDIIGKRFNQAIKASSGKYISFLYSDDFINKKKFEIQLKEFNKLDEEYGVVYGDVEIFNQYNKIKLKRNVIKFDGYGLKYQLDNIHLYGHIDMVSPLIKKECLLQHKFLENIFAEGEGIFLRISQNYKFKYLAKTFAYFRDTKFNRGKAILKNLNFHKKTLKVLKKNEIFKKKDYQQSLRKYLFYFTQNVAWGNFRANGGEVNTKKLFFNIVKINNIKFFNIKTLLIFITILLPSFFLKRINTILNKILKVKTSNVLIENYGGKDY